MASAETAETAGRDLSRHGERVERLLEELRGLAGPSAFARVEELVRLLVELYGAGLERLLGHAAEAGAPAAELDRRLSDDELVSSLLLLHGLHPLPTRARVERAVAAAGARLGGGARLELLGLSDDGRVRLRLGAAPGGCPSTRARLLQAVREAIQEAAPEVSQVDVEDAAAAEPARLVTLGGPRGRR
ncbi:NifU family protein [Anaeromyxobacter paludicola]|uniref:NIF system FeS cluster assembly NifU C-terminal domain-containing protein n=1 Tax=Anaeromyxobacter paludicola TaxID=2918171 RepID=A0ABN6N425_9BACT|nr:NifU family protein [Anaeromyxobacter paludicola]BDG07947.1 hypothetical protein AMPC_10600 [Anaeromyxobacter paludicola]